MSGFWPLVARDLRRRRAAPTAAFIGGYLAVLSLAVLVIYRTARGARRGAEGVTLSLAAGVGRLSFHVTLFVVLGILCFVAPALGASVMSADREHGALLGLRATAARPFTLATAKLTAAAIPIVALVLAAAPLYGVSFLLGGVQTAEIVRGLALVLAAAITLAGLGVAGAGFTRTAMGSATVAYGAALLLVVGTLLAFVGQGAIVKRTNPASLNHAPLMANPFVAVGDAIAGPSGGDERFPSPFSPFQELIGDRQTLVGELLLVPRDPGGGFMIRRVGQDLPPTKRGTALWKGSAAWFIGLTAASIAVATRRLRLPGRRSI